MNILNITLLERRTKSNLLKNIEKAVTLQGGVDCMAVFHGVVVENADWILKRKFEKRMSNKKIPRPIWLTTKIESEIKKKRNINRRDMLDLEKSELCSLSIWTRRIRLKKWLGKH